MRGRPSDGPSGKVFLYKFSQFVMFFRAQGVYFQGLRFECWFKIYGMVPEAMLGELLRLPFTENIEVGMMCLGDMFL